MKLMSEYGVPMVTVGLVSWAMMEPRLEEFDFGGFDEVVTASPLPWLSHQYPEILSVRADGTRPAPGAHWPRDRYGDLDAPNTAWSTTFWSQRYGDWSEIVPPRVAPTFANPAQQPDFHRFSSDASLGCCLAEKEVLDRVSPGVAVTTNVVGQVEKTLDRHCWVPHEDVVTLDS